MAVVPGFPDARIDGSSRHDVLVNASFRLIHASAGTIKVRDLLKELPVSERQFERRFGRAVGVSAKFYLRIVRFEEAVRRMRTGGFRRLSDIAYDLGYSDQSHFINDIRTLTGYTPKHLLKFLQPVLPRTNQRPGVRSLLSPGRSVCHGDVRLQAWRRSAGESPHVRSAVTVKTSSEWA
jgi:AraC-like DNA-binding protein